MTDGPTPTTDDPGPKEREFPTLLQQMGGVQGIVASTIPVAVFVVVNIVSTLQIALIAALVAGVAIALYRIVRKQPLQPAVSGLFGVGVAAFIAYRTGEARGFYLPRLIYSAVFALAFLVSVLVRWPLAGVVWHGINGEGQSWATRPPAVARLYLGQPALDARVRGPAGGAGPALQRRRDDLARHRAPGHGLPARRRRAGGHGVGRPPRPRHPPRRLTVHVGHDTGRRAFLDALSTLLAVAGLDDD